MRPAHTETHLVDHGDLPVDHFTLEWLHDDGLVRTSEPRLTSRRHDLSIARRRYLDHSNDVPGYQL